MNEINNNPFILNETADFAVVYKPPRMHSAPLKDSGGGTLVDWYAAQFPQVGDFSGKRGGEGGLLHRLDFETHGLVLFAKNQQSLDILLTQQDEGNCIKEYSAICKANRHAICPESALVSFPPPPFSVVPPSAGSVIESFFRPFGPGRTQVRPVTDDNGKGRKAALIAKDHGGYYRTEIVNVTHNDHFIFIVRLKRGFRHQIRCHLAWIGCPVVNDPIYGDQPADGFFALRSHALFFSDPVNGERLEYRIDSLDSMLYNDRRW